MKLHSAKYTQYLQEGDVLIIILDADQCGRVEPTALQVSDIALVVHERTCIGADTQCCCSEDVLGHRAQQLLDTLPLKGYSPLTANIQGMFESGGDFCSRAHAQGLVTRRQSTDVNRQHAFLLISILLISDIGTRTTTAKAGVAYPPLPLPAGAAACLCCCCACVSQEDSTFSNPNTACTAT